MKYINSYKVFESSYETVRRYNNTLEDKFKLHDPIVKHLNTLYDNVKIKHRGNMWYDIYYTMGGPQNHKTIQIGAYDVRTSELYLWECDKLSDYSPQGIDDYKGRHVWKGELNEESFDRYVSKWYDIYDNL